MTSTAQLMIAGGMICVEVLMFLMTMTVMTVMMIMTMIMTMF